MPTVPFVADMSIRMHHQSRQETARVTPQTKTINTILAASPRPANKKSHRNRARGLSRNLRFRIEAQKRLQELLPLLVVDTLASQLALNHRVGTQSAGVKLAATSRKPHKGLLPSFGETAEMTLENQIQVLCLSVPMLSND